jgi:hypothetical protein
MSPTQGNGQVMRATSVNAVKTPYYQLLSAILIQLTETFTPPIFIKFL